MCLVPGGHKRVLEAMLHFQIYAHERKYCTIIALLLQFYCTIIFITSIVVGSLAGQLIWAE